MKDTKRIFLIGLRLILLGLFSLAVSFFLPPEGKITPVFVVGGAFVFPGGMLVLTAGWLSVFGQRSD